MYADRAQLSHGPRSVSFGASLAISSAIVAALAFVAPNVVPRAPAPPLVGVLIKETPPPPPDDRVEKPKNDLPRETEIFVPDPILPPLPDRLADVTTTRVEPVGPTPIDLGRSEGTGVVAPPIDPPKPVPALIAAQPDPRYANGFQPQYPSAEMRNGREGTVIVRVRIGVDGRVRDIEKVQATSDAFFESTRRQALSRWRFKPATRGGIPEESWKRMSVRFEMKE